MDLNDVFRALEKHKYTDNDVLIFQVSIFCTLESHRCNLTISLYNISFQKLITIAPLYHSSMTENDDEERRKIENILQYILEIISYNVKLGEERILLACHAFYALLSARYDSQIVQETVMHIQELDLCEVRFLENRRIIVSDLKLFKLLNAYGYLQMNRKGAYWFDRAFLAIFDLIYRDCLKYTKYSYFAYKVLRMWCETTMDTCFWHGSDIILEQKLEAIIFSNWSNVINDVSKQNAQIFNMYLRIMSKKYDRFLEYMFEMCVANISWQNEAKYVILTEICQLWDNVEAMTREKFLRGLCISLTKNPLRCGGTKLYLIILRKVNGDEWEKTFGKALTKFIRWKTKER